MECFESNYCKSKKPCGIIIVYSNSYKCKKKLWVSIIFDYQLQLFIQLLLWGPLLMTHPVWSKTSQNQSRKISVGVPFKPLANKCRSIYPQGPPCLHRLASNSIRNSITDIFLDWFQLVLHHVSKKKDFVFGTFGLGSNHQGCTVFCNHHECMKTINSLTHFRKHLISDSWPQKVSKFEQFDLVIRSLDRQKRSRYNLTFSTYI